MKSAFLKELWRTIIRKPGRFLALFGIIALGAGFYAGLRMTCPDMKLAVDHYLDATHSYDLRIVGTMGLSDADGLALEELDAVQDVMMSKQTDVLALFGETTYATRLHSLPASVQDSTCDDGVTVVSDDPSYLNRLILAEGRWPRAPGECVLSVDRVSGAEAGIGDTLALTEAAGGLDDTLAVRELTIVGKAHMPYYVSSAGIDTTTLGSGIIQQIAYVADGTFSDDYPYTDAFVIVEGAADQQYGTPGYNELIDAARGQIDGIEEERCEARLDELTDEMYQKATSTWSGLMELAEYRLSRTQAEIDDPEKPEWLVLDRSKNAGTNSYVSDADRVDSIASLFPFIFFLVAALVALTTMTRMVDEERMLAGTYKALGYSRARITSKYLIYALAASGLGVIVGISTLSYVLPSTIMRAYAIIYYVPGATYPIDIPLASLSSGLSIGITLFATWFSIATTLRERPASLLQPKAPKMGKRILLERIGPIWRRLSFTWKVTFRNIFRYKKRFIMTVIGIAGCTALLLTGLGLRDSINDIIDIQYGEIIHFNAAVAVDEDPSAADQKRLDDLMKNDEIDQYAWVSSETMLASGPRAEDKRIDVVVPSDPDAFEQMKTLRTRVGHDPIELGPGMVVLNEKLGQELGVGVGETLLLRHQDAMGNATGDTYEATVGALCENYIYNYLYLDAQTYEQIFDEAPKVSAVYLNVAGGPAERSSVEEKVDAIRAVRTVSYNDETIDTYRDMLRSVDLIVVVLVVSAGALAFIVLYNLTNINIEERMREIATLKVLGFTPGETRAYIFRETLMLALIGALLGLVLGLFLEGWVVTSAEVDQVMFGRTIHTPSFVWAFIVTIVFSVISMLLMMPKLTRINMVESLKSNE